MLSGFADKLTFAFFPDPHLVFYLLLPLNQGIILSFPNSVWQSARSAQAAWSAQSAWFTVWVLLRPPSGVIPKSQLLEVRPRSTSDEFLSRVIIGNCQLFQYGGLLRQHQYCDLYIITYLPCENTLPRLNQGNFAKFCMAVSFTIIDVEFLVQQSFSLTP